MICVACRDAPQGVVEVYTTSGYHGEVLFVSHYSLVTIFVSSD